MARLVHLSPIQCQSDNLKIQTIGSVGFGYLRSPADPWPAEEEVEELCSVRVLWSGWLRVIELSGNLVLRLRCIR